MYLIIRNLKRDIRFNLGFSWKHSKKSQKMTFLQNDLTHNFYAYMKKSSIYHTITLFIFMHAGKRFYIEKERICLPHFLS